MDKETFVLSGGFLPEEKLSCIKSSVDLALNDLDSYKGVGSWEQNKRNIANGVLFLLDSAKELNDDLVSLKNQKSEDVVMEEVHDKPEKKTYTVLHKELHQEKSSKESEWITVTNKKGSKKKNLEKSNLNVEAKEFKPASTSKTKSSPKLNNFKFPWRRGLHFSLKPKLV